MFWEILLGLVSLLVTAIVQRRRLHPDAHGGVSLDHKLWYFRPVEWFGRWYFQLPPVRTRIYVRPAIRIQTPEGIELEHTHFYPSGSHDAKLPTLLIRTPYNRAFFTYTARRLASHGFHVISQDTRGRSPTDKTEEFFPVQHESVDGAATVHWIQQQPWFNGRLAFYGPSYLGLVQFAAADGVHHARKARKALAQTDAKADAKDGEADEGEFPLSCLAPVVASSLVKQVLFPQQALHLDLAARWLWITLNVSSAQVSFPRQMWNRLFTNSVRSTRSDFAWSRACCCV